MMRKFTDHGTDLERGGVTRFATLFLESLNRQKDKIQTMFISSDWKESKWSKEDKGKKVYDIFCLHICKPLAKVLRFVNSGKEPLMGHTYKAMEAAREEIKLNLKQNESKYGPILKIVDDKWDMQLERPQHLARYFLNATYFCSNPEIERRGCFMETINKCNVWLHPDLDVPDKVSMELDLYCYFRGHFETNIVVRQRMKIHPSSWWANHGQIAPNLQRMAQRILNLTCTSSGYDHNCSTFEMYNLRLKERHLERFQIEDPIAVKDLDPTSKWLVEQDARDELVFEGESFDMDPSAKGGWYGIKHHEIN
ncbi:hypothetical protein AMTRI_Chr02g213590 [Amborella trichopoda]